MTTQTEVAAVLTKVAVRADAYGFELDGAAIDRMAREVGATAAQRFHMWGAIRLAVFGSDKPAPLADWLQVATHPEVVEALERAAAGGVAR